MLKLSDQLYDLHHEVKKLEDKVDGLEVSCSEAETELEEASDDNEDLLKKVAALEKQLEREA